MKIRNIATSLFMSLLLASQSYAEPTLINGISATVDDDIILVSEVNDRITEIKKQFQDRGNVAPPADVLREQIIERLIVENLQLQIGERMGIRVDDNRLNEALNGIASQNGVNLEQFVDMLASEGIEYADFRAQIHREMIMSGVQQRRVGSRIRISDQEITDFLNNNEDPAQLKIEYNLLHILISLPEEPTPEQIKATEEKVNNVHQQLLQGANFNDTAVRVSNAQNALEGGNLGWRNSARLPPLFVEQIKNMQIGSISAPIQTPGGYHIIQLAGKRGDEQHMVEQTNVRHILLTPNDLRNRMQSKDFLENLRNRIERGDDFADMARQYSDDPGSTRAGGDLSWVNPGDMVPEFDEMMKRMSINELSPVFESQFGWHVLQVTERRTADMSEEFRRLQARNALYKRKYDEELELWLREIRAEAYVVIK